MEKKGWNSEELICSVCNQCFSRKDNLTLHVRRKHLSSRRKPEKCKICGKQYSKESTLLRHLTAHVNPVTNKEKIESRNGAFICDKCGNSFNWKNSLKRHITTMHPNDNMCGNEIIRFECAHCNVTFNRKDLLRRHILTWHMFENDPSLVCKHCSKAFKTKTGIEKHVRTWHSCDNKKEWHLTGLPAKCLECEEKFPTRLHLASHYNTVHGIAFEYEEFVLESADAFEQWKNNWQQYTTTQFRLLSSYKNRSVVRKWFVCHRSGNYVEKATKRITKQKGSKKLQGICPANIAVKVKNQKHFIKIQKTHVGHKIFDQEEIRFMSVPVDERQKIAAELSAGVPIAKIVQKSHLTAAQPMTETETINRMRFLQYRDVFNIKLKCAANADDVSRSPTKAEASDISDFPAKQEAEMMVFRKDAGVVDASARLRDEDRLIVIMDHEQERYLREHGHKVVCLDGTFGTQNYEFTMHTLLVLDDDCEGIPAAFALSNRDDEVVVSVFFECLRDRVGIVKPRTLITDLQPAYRDCWNRVMEPATFNLLCQWHVHKAWSQKQTSLILDAVKRSEVKRYLNSLLNEVDAESFEEQLINFLMAAGNNDDDDEDGVHAFVEYFRYAFAENKYAWASCYRQHAGINTNSLIRNFHGQLKRKINDGKKIKSLDECVRCLSKYLTYESNEMAVKSVMGKRLAKLDELNRNHRKAESQCRERQYVVECVDANTWHVQSSKMVEEGVVEVYVIERIELPECLFRGSQTCRLLCRKCKICFHEYQCSCPNSSINNSMCKHIHMVGMSLALEQSLLSKETVQLELECPSIENVPLVDDVLVVEKLPIVEKLLMSDSSDAEVENTLIVFEDYKKENLLFEPGEDGS